MKEQFTRTEMLFGEKAMEKLAAARVAVFGIGGVGGYVAEALARSGVGAIDLTDGDKIALSNINRQIIATLNTVGRFKAEVAAERISTINAECKVTPHNIYYMPETQDKFDFTKYDYIVDAIDNVTGKLTIIENAKKCGVPVISAMGAGNKLNATAFKVGDISQTSVCPLARVMRRELKKRGIAGVKVVYSTEEPKKCGNGAGVPASNSFVPAVAGLIIAGEVIKDLAGLKGD
ncbi:MAG: tRNA threonylcarbamoyladenosine dehydratase [Roseburia sp.]|nr:tRNA threonylcarbamoyladenosine dehydratase [Roseburia sp.]